MHGKIVTKAQYSCKTLEPPSGLVRRGARCRNTVKNCSKHISPPDKNVGNKVVILNF